MEVYVVACVVMISLLSAFPETAFRPGGEGDFAADVAEGHDGRSPLSDWIWPTGIGVTGRSARWKNNGGAEESGSSPGMMITQERFPLTGRGRVAGRDHCLQADVCRQKRTDRGSR